MQDYQRAFIEFALRYRVLQFGQFTLKSGRVSPYFFNAGLFNDGEALAGLGQFYAQALQRSGLAFDILYGPAYKGIPLTTAVAIALANQYGRNVAYCFNRKEIKQHGEGGQFVGAPLQGRVVIVDDVMTAGTAIRESVELIGTAQAKLQGVLIAFDRQEKGLSGQSAVQEVAAQYGVPVISIIRFTDLLAYVAVTGAYAEWVPAMQAYRQQYGVS